MNNYDKHEPIANKILQPDGSIITLQELLNISSQNNNLNLEANFQNFNLINGATGNVVYCEILGFVYFGGDVTLNTTSDYLIIAELPINLRPIHTCTFSVVGATSESRLLTYGGTIGMDGAIYVLKSGTGTPKAPNKYLVSGSFLKTR